MEKDRESEKVERVDVEENKVFQNLSTSYQQIVDNLWIMWAKIYTIHTGASIHIFFPVFLKKSLD